MIQFGISYRQATRRRRWGIPRLAAHDRSSSTTDTSRCSRVMRRDRVRRQTLSCCGLGGHAKADREAPSPSGRARGAPFPLGVDPPREGSHNVAIELTCSRLAASDGAARLAPMSTPIAAGARHRRLLPPRRRGREPARRSFGRPPARHAGARRPRQPRRCGVRSKGSKGPAHGLLERLTNETDPARRDAMVRELERTVSARAEEVARYLDPERSAPPRRRRPA